MKVPTACFPVFWQQISELSLQGETHQDSGVAAINYRGCMRLSSSSGDDHWEVSQKVARSREGFRSRFESLRDTKCLQNRERSEVCEVCAASGMITGANQQERL